MGDNNNEFSIKYKMSNGRVFRYRFLNHYFNYNLYLYKHIYCINMGFQFFYSAPFTNSRDAQFEYLWFKWLFSRSICLDVFFLPESVSSTNQVPTTIRVYGSDKQTSFFNIFNQLKLCRSNQLKSNEFNKYEMMHNSINIIYW